MRWGWHVLLGLAVCCSTSVAAVAEKRVALVIGNSAYQSVPKLSAPTNDAAAIAKLLKTAGFDVVDTHLDVGGSDFRRAVREFSRFTWDADVAIVFYAGHGMPVRSVNYLIPIDAKLESDIDVDDEAVSLDRMLGAVEPAKRLRVVILDSCRDNPFLKTMKRSKATGVVSRGLAPVDLAKANTLVAVAAKAETICADGNGSNSTYTTALLKYIVEPGVDLRTAFDRVRNEVLETTGRKQEPRVYGSLEGAAVALVPAPPKPAKTDAVASAAPAVAAAAVAPPLAGDANAGARRDYELAAQVGTKEAWEAYLRQYQVGFYADLARAQLAKSGAEGQGRVKAERERMDKERLASEQADRLEKERLAREERERQEKERLAREQAERIRIEKERIAREQAERRQSEKERIAREQAEHQRLEKERVARELVERQRLENERLAGEQGERERLQKERLAREEGERREKQRLAREQTERQRQEKEGIEPAERHEATTEAARKIREAELTPPTDNPAVAPPMRPLSSDALVKEIKKQLKRVGCYAGPIDDNWMTPQTDASVKKFIKAARSSASPSEPTMEFLDALRGKSGRVCPLECRAREVESAGQCVAKTCKNGFDLDDDGNCVRQKSHNKKAERSRESLEPSREASPSADREPAGEGGRCGAKSCSAARSGCMRHCVAYGGRRRCDHCSAEYGRCMQTGTFIGKVCQLSGLARN